MSQPTPQVIRHLDAEDLASSTSQRLLESLISLQADGRVAQLCLTGGRIALRTYHGLARLVAGSELDPARLELWWGDERFVPTDAADRNAGATLATLAGRFPLEPSRTHPMPAADGVIDAAAAAAAYAKELGDTHFDLVLLGVGADGHIASIFPNHPSAEPTTQSVIGVSDSPEPPADQISLTVSALSRASQVWFLASGSEKAAAVAGAVNGDVSMPAARVRGEEATLWLVDQAAAGELPYFECSF